MQRKSIIKRCTALLCVGIMSFSIFGMTTSVLAATNKTIKSSNDEDVQKSIDPTDDADGYASFLYDNTNGLPTSEANAITETSEGFIWIGGYSGLVRYDGNSFERMDSTDGIASVVSLFADSKDRLWIGTNDSGVAVKTQADFTVFNREDGLTSLSVRDITEDSKGNIYLATTSGIAIIDSDFNLRMIDDDRISDSFIEEIKVTRNDILYGTTVNEDIFTIKDGKIDTFIAKGDLAIGSAYTMLIDEASPDYAWVGSKETTVYYGKISTGFADAKVIDVSPLEYINYISQVDGKLWVCADNGVGVISGDTFTRLDNIQLDSSIENMMTDYQGNLWFTSSKQGIMKIVPSRFTDIYEKYNLEPEVVNTTCIYDNKLFVGSKDNGLKILSDGRVLDSFPLKSCTTVSGASIGQNDLIAMLNHCRIRSIVTDKSDNLWIATYEDFGLIRYKDGVATCFTTDDGLPSERVRTVVERKDGSYMIAGTGGMVVLKDDRVSKIYDSKQGVTNTEVLTVCEAANSDMIFGTDGGGIYVVSGGKVRNITIEDGLTSEVIMRIKKDLTRDIYWFVTSNSIGYLDGDYNVNIIKKFPYSNNFDLYQNSKDDMWVLSSNGIYVVATEELIKNGDISPIYYSRDNGLNSLANANSYSALSDEGDLYVSGTTGVAKVNIEMPFESVSNLKMVVPFVEADDELVYPNNKGEFTIDSDVQKITVYSYVYNYSLVNPMITYYLEGFEKNKTTFTRDALVPVDYTNLKGGNYHFVMKLTDPAGDDEQQIAVSITKKRAFYEQAWFIALAVIVFVIIIIGLVSLYISYRTKKYKKKEAEDKALIREISQAFAKTIDMKDKYTNGHSTRVAEYTVMLARELGYDEDTVEKYYNIALLHDIGKIGVPPEVLNKPGKLTDEEFKIIKSHSGLGYNALKDISIMPELAIGAGSHHERPDGKGYPKGLKGDEIPRVAQIIAVADTFDAMYSNRPYRNRMNFDKVVSIITEVSGTQLTEDVVDAFLRLVKKGEFRDPDDDGGGSTEDISNIRAK